MSALCIIVVDLSRETTYFLDEVLWHWLYPEILERINFGLSGKKIYFFDLMHLGSLDNLPGDNQDEVDPKSLLAASPW